ncbi:PAS domain S-box protein [Acidicapsa dinghuensis]|uniref:PAS domain S-box protein n=1 Tax=Acidicapsa dinghuensis TaxID=2218256 RepID=A0ABW1ED11_9BACT|nr:bifunctional diguanylate cyclase/phosphodiesterase [Acidicapsa dinghuensis]
MCSIAMIGDLGWVLPWLGEGPALSALVFLCLVALSACLYLYWRVSAFKSQNDVLRALVYDRPDVGVAEFRFGRLVERCNDALERIFGMSREEIIGKALPLPDSRKSQWEELEARLRAGFPYWNVETIRVRGDGSVFRAYISAFPIFSRNRRVVGYLGMITEERWMSSLEAEASRLAALADNSSDFLLLLDPNLRIIYANPTVAAMTGIDFDSIDGTDVLDCFAPDDRHSARHYFDVLKSGMNDEYSPRLKLKHRETGRETLVQFGIYPLFESPNEAPSAIACVAKDRADEVALGKKLRLKQREVQVVLERLPVGIVMVDLNGIVGTSNRRFQELLGYATEEISSTPFAHFVHPEDLREGRRRFLELAAGHLDHYEAAKRLVHKDGRVIRARMTVLLVRREDGAANHIINIVVPVEDVPPADDIAKVLSTLN